MGKLDGKVAVITGGISGIGAASAQMFAEEGAKLVLVDMNEKLGEEFTSDLEEKGYEAIFIKANVTNQEDAANVFDQTIEKFGKLDILFNNAGIGVTKATHEVTFEEFRNTVAVDLDAVFLFAKLAIEQFRKQGDGGVIVNTSSMYGWVGAPGNAAYNSAKGGVINLTRSLAIEYAAENIRVNALCPGYIETPILGETDREILTQTTPMKRLGKPEEMASAALFLASEDSSFMTGNTLTVDGGYTAQ